MLFEEICQFAHETLEAYRKRIGETGYGSWETINPVKKTLHRKAVRRVIKNPGLSYEEAHEIWVAASHYEGFKLGETIDLEAKTHPDMIPYDDLPEHQKIKDRIFVECIRAVLPLYVEPENGTHSGGSTGGRRGGKHDGGYSVASVHGCTIICNQF